MSYVIAYAQDFDGKARPEHAVHDRSGSGVDPKKNINAFMIISIVIGLMISIVLDSVGNESDSGSELKAIERHMQVESSLEILVVQRLQTHQQKK